MIHPLSQNSHIKNKNRFPQKDTSDQILMSNKESPFVYGLHTHVYIELINTLNVVLTTEGEASRPRNVSKLDFACNPPSPQTSDALRTTLLW